MINFELNGQTASLDLSKLDPEMPLLWALRDYLKLTGTKYGCGKGLCGACTVHIDGHAMRSCLTPISSLSGKQVTTIEGLSENAAHPVQQAWINNNVPQCGYCQPGQIMSASALLASNPKPNDEDINRAMSGNLCRCGTYVRIRKAIHDAAEIMEQEK
ncbi:MAG: (2Fe-2S)-binding protein [Pseudomonadales bacterium]|nr:(2Fe-2S)-binding protein [Pseudomonadales bacterium]